METIEPIVTPNDPENCNGSTSFAASGGAGARSKFKTIVADPPWDHSDGTGKSYGHLDPRGRSGKHGITLHSLPYGVMSVEEISALPVRDMAEQDATLYLWTTNRYLRDSYGVAEAWGFRPSTLLVWCKPQNQGLFGGVFLSNVEFILVAGRGSPKSNGKQGSRWFTWPRGKHSEKPAVFQDIVESVSPGPYLELFARCNRLGWSTWGNECLQHVRLHQEFCYEHRH